jgi:acetyl esterase/lipase
MSTDIPFGYLVGTTLIGWCTLVAIRPIRRPRAAAIASWLSGMAPSEIPHVFLTLTVASGVLTLADGDVRPFGWLALTLAAMTVVGLVVIIHRTRRAAAVLERALTDGLGDGWRDHTEAAIRTDLGAGLPWAKILLAPWAVRRHDVERTADLRYGEDPRHNRLDLYRHRSRPTGSPTFIHLHGGRFRRGRKNREGRPLLYHLASRGWTCISADYHLSPTPSDGFPEHLIDIKRVIAWVRTHGAEHGADPDTIVVSGSSAGAHLTMMAALTANDPRFQPGFEHVDTRIAAGVGFYGYYGALGADQPDLPSTPRAYLRSDTPPLLLVHGDNDTYTPVEGARHLARALESTSAHPVVLAALPGAQHSFDTLHSIRYDTVVNAVEAFATWTWTRTRAPDTPPIDLQPTPMPGRERRRAGTRVSRAGVAPYRAGGPR